MEHLFWIVDMIIPFTMIIAAFYYNKKAKQNISFISGFRTPLSLSSKENWQIAHNIASTVLKKMGIILIFYTILIKLIAPFSAEWLSLLNNGIHLIALISTTIYINHRLSILLKK